MNAEHDSRCSYWVDQLCTCHHIAALEEEAAWVQENLAFASPSYIHFSTMTAPHFPGYYPPGTYTMRDPAEDGIKYRAERRAEIYAKADALRKKT